MYWDGRYVCACVEEPLLEFILCMKDKYMTQLWETATQFQSSKRHLIKAHPH